MACFQENPKRDVKRSARELSSKREPTFVANPRTSRTRLMGMSNGSSFKPISQLCNTFRKRKTQLPTLFLLL